jgi:hypothetical protein
MGCDLRATVTGHKRPDIVTAKPICFIHTDAAIFAIDEDGVCCYVTSATGEVPRNANRCRGAEYVACLDLTTSEGLVADPRIGATGLFVGRGASQKSALLRTGPITRVEFVDDEDEGDVSQVKPVEEIERQVEEKLEELDAVELEPFEVVEESAAHASGTHPAQPHAGFQPAPAPPVPLHQPGRSALPPPPPPVAGATAASPSSNVHPFRLQAPTPPPRRSSAPPAPNRAEQSPRAPRSNPAMMDPAQLLEAALAQQEPTGEGRPPSTSDIDLGWGGVDPRKTRVGMPIVKLS